VCVENTECNDGIDFSNLDQLMRRAYIGMKVYLNIADGLDDTGRMNTKK
jgi:hypothetical protein